MTASEKSPLRQEAVIIPVAKVGERFASLRIVEPRAERAMLRSIEKYGQMTPVVVCRGVDAENELLDGFKRLRAGRQLGLSELTAKVLDVSLRAGKAAMLQLNRVGRAISSMEEALVVHSLCHEDGLNQVEIAVLLGHHKSWVCRRIALIRRLSDEVKESIRLGILPASIGAELARLQRCNQERLLASIHKHRLTWRETRKVVKALENSPGWGHEAILRDPRGVVLAKPDEEVFVDPRDDRGLSLPARQLQRKLLEFDRMCLETALLFSLTELCQFEVDEEKRLRAACGRTLQHLAQVEKELRAGTCGTEASL
ncbi:MAG: ParB N-terminal domain-containing protein [Desulfobacterales bacterium]|nr:ParB N-terminal domain-containing protein [Desulfobacterales bacterium]